MAKPKVTAESFLKNMGIGETEPTSAAATATAATSETEKPRPATSRAGLKHIGGYVDRETAEQVAILRARLNLDNSELIKRAIEEMYQRETAARKFGDR